MTASWLSALDAFEAHLDVQAALVDDGRYDEVVAFVPPVGLPPLPRVLVTRASELLGRSQTQIERVRAIREDTYRQLAQLRRPALAKRPAPAYVDQQA